MGQGVCRTIGVDPPRAPAQSLVKGNVLLLLVLFHVRSRVKPVEYSQMYSYSYNQYYQQYQNYYAQWGYDQNTGSYSYSYPQYGYTQSTMQVTMVGNPRVSLCLQGPSFHRNLFMGVSLEDVGRAGETQFHLSKASQDFSSSSPSYPLFTDI